MGSNPTPSAMNRALRAGTWLYKFAIRVMKILNKQIFFVSLVLAFAFFVFIKSCISIGFFDCFGPGCGNKLCNSVLFFPFVPFYVVAIIMLLPLHWFLQITFGIGGTAADKISIVVVSLLMLPVFYAATNLVIRICKFIFSKVNQKKDST